MFAFVTDNGVFSKTDIDEGSKILLETVSDLELKGDILDMGCGYGVIGIVVKKLFPDCFLTSVDVNPRAVELTEINSQSNHAELTAFVSDGFEEVKDSYDWILTNPPIRAGKKVIYRMFEDAYVHLKDGGSLVAVIRRKQGAESAVKEFERIFSNCEVITREKGYWVIQSRKLTA